MEKTRTVVGSLKTKTYSLARTLSLAIIITLASTSIGIAADRDELASLRQEIARLAQSVEELEAKSQQDHRYEAPAASISDKLQFAGYGEMHANFTEGSESDKFDFHRLVLYIGYEFADWIKLHSETELEHAFVNDGDGEISLEQVYVDFLLSDSINIRAGRVLTPLGIINKVHEPTTFNGVERPNFSKFIIPTTWSSDGIGIFGSLCSAVNYEFYVVAGLDGDEFDSSGIRSGRIKSRASLNEPALTGRIDVRPELAAADQSLRLGLSGYAGGLDNIDGGGGSGKDGEIAIASADFEYSIAKFDFRGVIAHTNIDGARAFGDGVAEEMFGWYLEGAYHFWPDTWKTGKLAKSDAVVFLRYDDYNTQHEMPSGIAEDKSKNNDEWTFGVNFYLTSNFVVKADYQIRNDATGRDLDDLFNLGLGWTF